MEHLRAARLTRAELAGSLFDLAVADPAVARALTACEAWETGYVAMLLTRAEASSRHDVDDLTTSPRERALTAIDRAIRHDNPFLRVHQSGVQVTSDAIDAMLTMLQTQSVFHEVAGDLERRTTQRTAPPA
jgi:hypothetical protein